MDVRLLGPVQLWRADSEIPVGRPRQRCVLAALAMTPGEPVDLDQLLMRVWADELPGDVRNVLYTHVSRLRRALAQAGAEDGRAVLRRAGGGYVLDVPEETVDVHRVRRLAAQADAHRGHGPAGDRKAVELLGAAVRLWRGVPLAGLSGAWVERTRDGLGRERLAVHTEWLAARLRLGQHAAVIGPLSDLLADNPMAESLVGLLMLALYRSGRQTDALKAYARLRRQLVDSIGDEPGAQLRRLHEQILRRDPALDQEMSEPAGSGRSAASGGTRLPAPAQLPADAPGFSGRTSELELLDSLLTAGDEQPSAVVISAIDGMAGVGKTALAVHWGHRVRHRFPDGQLYVDLRGHATGPALRPVEALARLLVALGLSAEQIPTDEEQSAGLYRSVLAGRRVLVVLDNAASADQVRPLLPGAGASVVLVTSRNQLRGLVARDGARLLSIDVLDPDEARELLSTIVGPARTDAEPDAVAELARLCGHLPLALRIAAANLAARPRQRICDVVAQLRDRDRLDALTVPGDPHAAVPAAFDLSLRHLPRPACLLFRLLGLLPGPDVTADAAAALAGYRTDEAARLLRTLADAHLVAESDSGRYTLHDLLRHYAAGAADRHLTAAERDAALGRLYDYYLDLTVAAARSAYQQMLLIEDGTTAIGPFDGPVAALAWLDAERANLVAAVRLAAGRGWHAHAWRLADNLRGYFWLRAHLTDWSDTAHAATTAARAAGDQRALAAGHLSLASLAVRQDRYSDAIEQATTALECARRAGWLDGQAAALSNLGQVYARMGDTEKGIDHQIQALALHEQAGRRRHGQAAAMTNIGVMCTEVGRIAQAAEYSRRALAANRELGLRDGQAINLLSLGVIHHLTGRFAAALDDLGRAMDLFQAMGNSAGLGATQRCLAELHLDAGRYDVAAELAEAAVATAHDNGYQQFEAAARNTLAALQHRLGKHRHAADEYLLALRMVEALDGECTITWVDALAGLAAAHLDLGDREQARRYADRALRAAKQSRLRLQHAQVLTVFAELHLADCDAERAVADGQRALDLHHETGHRLGQARASVVLGHATRLAGDAAAAHDHWRLAHALFVEIGTPEADEVGALLGRQRLAAAGRCRASG